MNVIRIAYESIVYAFLFFKNNKQTSGKKNIIETMTATLIAATSPSAGRMRPLNMLRDLPAVADLIELCFSSTLDTDSRTYIDQMRRSGRDSGFLTWAPRVIETVSLPLSGYVWEYKGRVVGNVSLIPFFRHGQKTFLVANVATHPDFRRQGIARQLTLAAMERAREKHAHSIWLHVRNDNPGAIQLYRDLGFVQRAVRTTWHASSVIPVLDGSQKNIQIAARPARDWPNQSEWLSRAYPLDQEWYHSQSWDVFKPGLINFIYQLMADITTQQWSAYRNGTLQAVFSCQRANARTDNLWAAVPNEPDGELVTALLLHIRRSLRQSYNLSFEYPAGVMDDAILAAGFAVQRTLAWMEAPVTATFQPSQRRS